MENTTETNTEQARSSAASCSSTDEAAALLIELQRELRAESEEWRTKRDDPYAINYAVAIACFAQAEAIERTLKTASKWQNDLAHTQKGRERGPKNTEN